MRYLFIAIVFFLGSICHNAFAQEQAGPTENMYGEIYYNPMGYEGTPYFQENWSVGKVYLKNGKTVENVQVKLNILTNDLIFYNANYKRLFKADKNTVDAFTLHPDSDDSLYFIRYEGPSLSYRLQTGDLIQVLQNGDLSLWVKRTSNVSSSNDVSNRDKIYPKNFYFLKTEKGVFETSLSVKSIVNHLPQRKQEIKEIVKTNKIRSKSEKNLSRLISLLNNPTQ